MDVHQFSSYINCVDVEETINGSPVTEDQIAAWAAEAEAGYDVKEMKKRGVDVLAVVPTRRRLWRYV